MCPPRRRGPQRENSGDLSCRAQAANTLRAGFPTGVARACRRSPTALLPPPSSRNVCWHQLTDTQGDTKKSRRKMGASMFIQLEYGLRDCTWNARGDVTPLGDARQLRFPELWGRSGGNAAAFLDCFAGSSSGSAAVRACHRAPKSLPRFCAPGSGRGSGRSPPSLLSLPRSLALFHALTPSLHRGFRGRCATIQTKQD